MSTNAKRVIVRYRVKPEHVAENEELVRAVYAELAQKQPDGLRYATFKLEDGVSFVHVASIETEDGQTPLAKIDAFKAFAADAASRCDEAPVVTEMDEVGSFHFFGG